MKWEGRVHLLGAGSSEALAFCPRALFLQASTAGLEPKGLLKCCLFFRPINGGQDCPGVNFEYQLCNTEECQKHFEDFRAQQCQQRNSHFEYQNTKHHWLPYEHPDCEQTPSLFLLFGCFLELTLCLHQSLGLLIPIWYLENLVLIGVNPSGFPGVRLTVLSAEVRIVD